MPQQDKQFTLSALYGNETLKQQLCHILARDQLAHAYVLQGDTGSGRRTLATQLAMALCCQANSGTVPCQTCSTCRKILQGIYTDLRYIAPRDGRKTISKCGKMYLYMPTMVSIKFTSSRLRKQ